MSYTAEMTAFLIGHYSNRLEAELKKGNTKAVSFLRTTLHQLKTNTYSIIN